MKVGNCLILLCLTLMISCSATQSGSSQTENRENKTPDDYLGEWRIIRYWSAQNSNSDKDVSEIAAEAQMVDYLPLYNSSSVDQSAFFTLLFVTEDSLVVFGTHCSGENSGNPKYVYPYSWENGVLLGDSLSSEFEYGDDQTTVYATYKSWMRIENGNLFIEQSQIYTIPSQSIRQVMYQKTEYEPFKQESWDIESEGSCTLFPQQKMPLPVF